MKRSYLSIRAKAFRYAINGLIFFFKEPHALIHLIVSLLTIILSWVLNVSSLEWIAVLGCCALVISLEAINSAIELLTNIVSPEWNDQAGLVKDMAAAAVLLASIFAVVIGCIIFIPKIYLYLF